MFTRQCYVHGSAPNVNNCSTYVMEIDSNYGTPNTQTRDNITKKVFLHWPGRGSNRESHRWRHGYGSMVPISMRFLVRKSCTHLYMLAIILRSTFLYSPNSTIVALSSALSVVV